MKTAFFGQFDNFWSGVFDRNGQKGTSTDQDLSFEPITKSLWPSIQNFSPVQEKYDRQMDGQRDAHPEPIGPPTFDGWSVYNMHGQSNTQILLVPTRILRPDNVWIYPLLNY